MNTIVLSLILSNCSKESEPKSRILYVDSYHPVYQWSAEINRAIIDVTKNENIELIIRRMDSKRNTSEEYKHRIALKIKNEIERIKPDLIIASDDNAMKYLIMPYFRESSIPVVFAGLNWDASLYELPYSNTTGMVEVTMITKIVKQLSQYCKGPKIGYLTNESLTARKEEKYTRQLFGINYISRYVSTLDQWKKAFVELQNRVDLLIIGNNAAINDWDKKEAQSFVTKNTHIPTGGFYAWLAPYTLMIINHSPYEQGFWAATAAIKILKGVKITSIPIATNKKGSITINTDLAKILKINFSPNVLKQSNIYEVR